MKFLIKLRLESFLRLLLPIFILVLIGGTLISDSNYFEEPLTVRKLSETPVEELEGAWVTFEVPFIYACYGYKEMLRNGVETGEIISKQYLIDANDTYFLTLSLSGNEMILADELLAECEAYMQGLTNQITKTFTVTGKVRELEGETLQIFHDAIDYEKMAEQEQALFLPFVVSIDEPWSVSYGMLAVGCVIILSAVSLGACTFAGAFQKKLMARAKVLSNNEPEQIYEYLDGLRKSGSAIHGLIIEGGIIFGRGIIGHYLYGNQDLVWAYQKITTVKAYGVISMGKESTLVLKMTNGKFEEIQMSGEQVKLMLEKIFIQIPTCAQGYSEQLETIYQKSREALRQIADLQHAQWTNSANN